MSEALSAYNGSFQVQGFDPKPAALLVGSTVRPVYAWAVQNSKLPAAMLLHCFIERVEC